MSYRRAYLHEGRHVLTGIPPFFVGFEVRYCTRTRCEDYQFRSECHLDFIPKFLADSPQPKTSLCGGRLLMARGPLNADSPGLELDHDVKKETVRDAVPIEYGSSSESSSDAEDKTFIRVDGEDTYVPIDKYEGRHRWDPEFEWDPAEEKKLVRKIDWRICTWVCLTFFALQLDRANIVQALTDNLLEDLNLNTNDYNYGQTIFYVCFLSAELPSQLISKKLGPDRWIPIQMICWSIVASCQAFLSGKSSFYACRALLGLIEGGFVSRHPLILSDLITPYKLLRLTRQQIPDTILYLSYWYKGRELPARLAWFWTSYQATSIIGAFLAAAILTMRGVNGLAG